MTRPLVSTVEVAAGKPSLHEIAALPYSKTAEAVRQHYDPDWGKVTDDGQPAKSWRVRFSWTISGKFDQEIDAETEDEAREIAKDWAVDDAYTGYFDPGIMKVTPVKGGEA
jgi:hypothetical protein